MQIYSSVGYGDFICEESQFCLRSIDTKRGSVNERTLCHTKQIVTTPPSHPPPPPSPRRTLSQAIVVSVHLKEIVSINLIDNYGYEISQTGIIFSKGKLHDDSIIIKN